MQEYENVLYSGVLFLDGRYHREDAPHFMILLPSHFFMKTSFGKLLYDEFGNFFCMAIKIELTDKIFRIGHIYCRTIHFVPDI